MTDTTDAMHRPTALGGRCAACGYLWPCPTERMNPEALLDGGDAVTDLIDVGWSLWKRRPAGSDAPSEGGVVVAVGRPDDPNEPPDWYRVLDWQAGRPRFRELLPGDFDPLLSDPPNSSTTRSAARRLCELVSRCRGTTTAEELDMVRAAYVLLLAVA